jgi:D-beta-D-heptose 7-phosphate kinase / D-beta-D-heptose 1-phosphate adenosyltransferase
MPSQDWSSAEASRSPGVGHTGRLSGVLDQLDYRQLERWGSHLAAVLRGGGRLLAAGNGGSAAEAQHLTSELVGKFRADRRPFSAIALNAESSTLTAVANDYGYEEVFARQVRAHGRPGDVLVLLSSSGQSKNLLLAAKAGQAAGLTVWGLTGAVPNPLAALCHEVAAVPAQSTRTVQECHLIMVHLICEAIETELGAAGTDASADHPLSPSAQAGRCAREHLGVGSGPLGRRPSGQPPLVVIGDVLLDRDLTGVVRRISPEAPVPVVDHLQASVRPGGAGLAAALGARSSRRPVVLVTALGADEHGVTLARLLRDSGVRVIDLRLSGPTPVKSRVRSDHQSLLMLSEAPVTPGPVSRCLSPAEREVILGAAAVLVSDYGGSMARQASVRAVLTEAVPRIPVVWDVHPAGPAPVPGVRLVTPNAREAEALVGSVTGQTLSADIERARLLLAEWVPASIAVTRGSAGAVLVDGQASLPLVVPAEAVRGDDSCGAGDCFAVTAAALLAEGKLVSESVTGAVDAAAAYVAAGGPTAAAPVCAGRERASPSDALRKAAEVRASGGLVVAASGCFDLLHAGHVATLGQARKLGDFLIVCLNDDDSVRRLKGEDRPIVPAHERAAVLAALAAVDGVVIFSEDRPDQVLREIQPDIYVKGSDYRLDEVLEAPLIASWGGQTVVLPYVERWSTTGVINKIAQRG